MLNILLAILLLLNFYPIFKQFSLIFSEFHKLSHDNDSSFLMV